jgi:hypothetical protein
VRPRVQTPILKKKERKKKTALPACPSHWVLFMSLITHQDRDALERFQYGVWRYPNLPVTSFLMLTSRSCLTHRWLNLTEVNSGPWEWEGIKATEKEEEQRKFALSSTEEWKVGVAAHTCNLSYSGSRDQEYHIWDQQGQKVTETPSQQIRWAKWYASVIPAMQEAGGGRRTVIV